MSYEKSVPYSFMRVSRRNYTHPAIRRENVYGSGRSTQLKLTVSMTTPGASTLPKLQALVYDVLPSTTAVFSYAIGSRKLSANEQYFVGAQTVVTLLQTTQITSDVCFITDHVAYASSDNITKIV